MNETQLWGGLGVIVALIGAAVIVLDSEFTEALGHGGIGEPMVLYGIGVAIAALVTVLVVGPSVVSGR